MHNAERTTRMKKRVFSILSILLSMALFASCSTSPAKKESVQPVIDNVKPISIANDTHSDKVITTPTFKIPKITEEYNDRFLSKDFVLSPILSDGMVLQANMPVRLWGSYTKDGGIVARVTNINTNKNRDFYGSVKNGKFEIYLDKTDYGGPYKIDFITSDGKSYTLQDVLFGEVFLCGGQSNMGWFMNQCYDGNTDKLLYQKDIDNGANANIRFFLVYPILGDAPVDELVGNTATRWQYMTPSVVRSAIAVGYFFAKELNAQYNIPIGFISACMGGTSIYNWLPPVDAQSLSIEVDKKPSVWYNSMVYPLRKLTVRGTIWYQGEGDFDNYSNHLKTMIEGWRRDFETPDMYFAVVQMPRYVNENAYFQCREEDKKISQMLDNVTYSVNIDNGLYPENKAVGDKLNDDGIHPYDKKPVGTRLANAVMQKFYGAEGVWRGPVIKSAQFIEGGVALTFDNVGSGLVLTGELAGFEVADDKGKFHNATPKIFSDTVVILKCQNIEKSMQVRYGYSNKSSLITKPLTSCAQSVSLYNTKGEDKKIAYPCEQFLIDIK
jgi:sialate O-acetylesterase